MTENLFRRGDGELAGRARGGDRAALAELRRRGYFVRLREEGGARPLSRSQLRLWLLERLGAGGDAYNLPAAYRIEEDMDTEALARAFAWLSARHGQLRSHFPAESGEPVQAVGRAAAFTPPFEIREAASAEAALADVKTWTAGGFSLSRPPLWRAAWWRVPGKGGLFAWVFHHAIADEWTLNLLAGELAGAYAAFAAGGEPEAPAPARSYFDWSDREAAYVSGPEGEADRDWWLGTWLPLPDPVSLPADFPRPAERSFSGGLAESIWPEDLAASLGDLARRERVTPFAAAMALTRAFLCRLTGRDDAMIGFPYANRDAPGAEAVAGFMANTLALRRRFDPAAAFVENLRRENGHIREALARGGYPFDALVERANPPRDPSRSPIFDVMATIRAVGGGRAGFSPVPTGYVSARFDAVFEWKEADGRLAGLDITYAASLFKPERVREWLAAMAIMTRAAVKCPELPASGLPLLDEAGRAAAVAAATGPVIAPPWKASAETPLGWLWNRRLAEHPERPAIEDADGVWTFRELDGQSRRLAASLRRRGAGSGDRIVSALPRSRRLAAALWGIWRIGAVYVPVDPYWPPERRRFVAENSGALLVVADAAPDFPGPDWLAPADIPQHDEAPATADSWSEDGPAYIIHTSGSTGVPKGVAVPPGGVVNMALAQAAAFGLTPGDRALAMASTAFDASMAEMLAGWAAGACVVAAPARITSDIQTLAAWLPRSRATLATVTPALLPLLPAAALAGVRTLLTAGEAARGADLRRHLEGRRIFNAYGPTECSVCAAMREVGADDCDHPFGVPIGLPIRNLSAHVLDASGQPCLPDTPGDLHLGGIGLALGYWNRPDLTRAAFAPSALVDGDILYRTGDRARRRRDGALVFLGRLDDQVKIRGHRVETGEVARVLAEALPENATAVLPRRDGSGEAELIALVAGGEDEISKARRVLAEKLPPALRPGRYLAVGELPRDGNGKVDRKALPALLARLDAEAETGREPSRPLEREVLAAWRAALGHGRLSVTDNFFLAGGHSLSSLRAAALTAEKTGLVVTGRDVLACPTAAELAAFLSARGKPAPPAAPKRDGGGDERLERAILRGGAPRLDAVALGYFPDRPPEGFPVGLWTRENVIDGWCGGGATLLHVYDTCFGRTGLVVLPLFHTDLFGDANRLMQGAGAGLTLARDCGARTVALTGMLPSVTRGGADIAERYAGPGWPAVTHGHATTAAALLKGTERLLLSAGRGWEEATAGFLGLGSVGALACRLWLEVFPPPRRLILADVPARRGDLRALAEEWTARTRGRTRVDIVESPAAPPDIWYEADLMLCAVGAGEIVDVARLRPGTLLADDSAPPCFSWEAAGKRMRRAGDILAIESGDLALPELWRRVSYRPAGLGELAGDGAEPHPADAIRMASCVLSGLLLANGLAACPRTIGPAPVAPARAHWRELGRLGVKAPPFRCGLTRPDRLHQ
jgi:amino acid adenylation domain-containing protein